jgi:photosystem II stability/assembly factor-like uncharacterized protein
MLGLFRSLCLTALCGFSLSLSAQTSPANTPWIFDGPQPLEHRPGGIPISGRATSIALDPSNWRTAYLGTTGGVWKTTNAGATWKVVTDTAPSVVIGAIAVAPSNPAVIYAGTGEDSYAIDSYDGQGVLKSTDAGASWTLEPGFETQVGTGYHFYSIVVSPTDPNLVLAASQFGVYRSTDGGATWTLVLHLNASALLIDKNNASIVYAGVASLGIGIAASPLYKSTDGGVTWAPLGASMLPSVASIVRASFAQDSNGQTLYIGLGKSDNSAPGYLFKTTDGGQSWTQLTSPPNDPGALDWYSNALAVVPGSNVLYAAGYHLLQSRDGGVSWHSITDHTLGLHQKNFAVTADGAVMYVADESGAFLTQNPSASQSRFESLNRTIGSMTFSKGFAILNDDKTIFAPTFGHGIIIGPEDDASLWINSAKFNQCAEGGSVTVSAAQDYAYAHCADGAAAGWIVNPAGPRSTSTWQPANNGIDQTDPTNFLVDIQADPVHDEIVYTATNRVYQSTNHATSWTPISPALTETVDGGIVSIAVAPSDPNTIYSASDDGIIGVTHNALAGSGSTWTIHPTFISQPFQPTYEISKIVVNPVDPLEIFLSVREPASFGFFHSLDGGNSFTLGFGASPSQPVPINSLAFDPDLVNIIYLASDIGVFSTQNTNGSATPLADGLPPTPVEDIQVDLATRTLFILTHGRGAWHLPLGPITPAQGIGFFSYYGNSFGSVTVGTSLEHDLLVINNFRRRTLTISSITVPPGYSQTNNCTATLIAGDYCTIKITFTPPSAGIFSGPLTVNTDQGSNSFTFTGQGID